MLESLGQAVAFARDTVRGAGESRLAKCRSLTVYLSRLRLSDLEAEPDESFIDSIDRLDESLSALDLRSLSLRTIQLALRHMEIKEAQDDFFSPQAWNRLGLLLAGHGEFDEARVVLNHALSKARTTEPADRESRSDEADEADQAMILANLSLVSLRADSVDEAEIWAHEAREAVAEDGGTDVRTALQVASVLVEVAKRRGDPALLEAEIEELDRIASALLDTSGSEAPEALAAAAMAVSAQFDAAWETGSVPRMTRAIGFLETLSQKLGAVRGRDHIETLGVKARLAAAEFGMAKLTGPALRLTRAINALDELARECSAALGPEHPYTLDALANLADARDGSSSAEGLLESIERVYTSRTNAERNRAKAAALEREKRRVRLIAHGGASYFLSPLQRFMTKMTAGLLRGVRFQIIISNPWNSLGIFFPVDDAGAPNTPDLVIRSIEASDYYRATFLPVLEAYDGLRDTFGEQIELRLTPIDVPGSTLITSDVGFFEPYMTTNLEARTQHGLQAFEIEFTKVSRYYELSVEMFKTQWARSSTVDQFRAREEQFKRQLRQLLDTRPPQH